MMINTNNAVSIKNKLSNYLILIIGNYLTINEVVILASTCRKFRDIFEQYYSFYEREWRTIFTSNLEIYRNLLLSSKSLDDEEEKQIQPTFLLKWNASKSWKKLIKIGLNLKSQWKSNNNVIIGWDPETTCFIGLTLFDTLRSPDLSVPALLKEDNCVEFHSTYQQFIYEYLFRQQDLLNGVNPKVWFTYLTEDEELFRSRLEPWIDEALSLSEEILENKEKHIFFRLRWYCCNHINFL